MIFLRQLPNLSPGHSPLKLSFSKQPVRIVLITKGWEQPGEGACPWPLPPWREGSLGTKKECIPPVLPVLDLGLPV